MTDSTGQLIARIRRFDWQFIKGSSLNSLGIMVGRVLGFAYSFVLAKAFSPDGVGQIFYVITLGGIVAIITQPFCQRVVAQYIGKYREDEAAFRQVMPSVWTVAIASYIITLLVGCPILFAMGRLSWELIVVFSGIVIFYGYYGIASGFLASSRLMMAYIGSNIAQIVMLVGLVYVFNVRNIALATAIYGLSYLPPILLLMWKRPLDVNLRPGFDAERIREIVRFSIPIWISQVLYVGFISLDILMLEHYTNNEQVGIYNLTKTLTSVFYFIPNGITMLLLPKLAGMTRGRRDVVLLSLGISLAVNIIGLIAYTLVYPIFVIQFVGREYFLSMEFALISAVGSILFGMHSILSSSLVGVGKASVETVSRVIMTLITVLCGMVYIPAQGAMGAAFTLLVAAIGGLVVYAGFSMVGIRKHKKTNADAAAT
jgi:O-antigen/teichoic acid export membrane protein